MNVIRIIIGIVVGISIFALLSAWIPTPICNDGWSSPSIGIQGACSHHGGVKDYSVLGILATLLSIAAGFMTVALIPRKLSAEELLIEEISKAITQHKTVSFLYKTPKQSSHTLRTVKPKALTNRNKWLVGYCEDRQAERTFSLSRMQEFKILDGVTEGKARS